MTDASAGPPVDWEILDARASFDEFAADFDRLGAAYYRGHPLLSSAFVGPLVRHFAGPQVRLCVARRAAEIIAIAILERRKAGIWSAFVPGQAQIAPVLIPPGVDLDGLIAVLPGMPIALELLSQDPDFSFLLAENDSLVDEMTIHETTMNISLQGEFADYWDRRPKKLRSNIGRYFRRLDKDHEAWRFEAITEPESISAALDRYGILESAGWKGRAQSAIHPDNAQGAFYRDVLHNFARSARARIYELSIGEELAASRIAVSGGSMLVMLKTTYRESLRRYSPGRLLLNLVLQHEFEARQFDVSEFYTDVTRDQLEWSTGTREILHLMHYRNVLFRGAIQCSRPARALLGALRR
jgi:hypothetical protein